MTCIRPARPRGRPAKGEADGRETLLRAAVTAFADHGFDGADLRGIALKAGVSPNLVRVHFGSKAGLWMACVERLAQDMAPGMAMVVHLAEIDSRPIRERLHDAISIMAAFYDAYPDIRDFVVRIASDESDRAALVADRLLRPAYEAGHSLIAAGIEAGVIKASHPALVFVLLNSMLSQPRHFPDLLARLAPEIAPTEARLRLIEAIRSTLLHDPGVIPAADPDAFQKGQP
ncbi:MAG: TetR/AcrR family transcriptional regulator [Hyphomicrobiales bacterium]|nr:MAG: TetR/AcrR family transcriptional regulator [Hyphomicrobiales bacterium]